MAKGDDYQPGPANDKRIARKNWVEGKKIVTTQRRGKDTGVTTRRRDPTYTPSGGKRTIPKDMADEKPYAAGSNIYDRKKRKTFKEYMGNNPANDPRKWQFHYKDPGKRHFSQTKGMSAQERRDEHYSSARRKAEKAAKLTGEGIYDVMKIEYEVKGIEAGTAQSKLNSKAMGRFGSTRTAKNVAAQKQLSQRRGAAKGRANTTTGAADRKAAGPFDAQAGNRKTRIA